MCVCVCVCVCPLLLYGSEIWVSSASYLKTLQAFVMWCLHVLRGVTRLDKKCNTELWSMAEIERVEVMVMRWRLLCLGHLEWLEDTRLPKCLLLHLPLGGKSLVRGQKMRWYDMIVRDLKKLNLIPDWRDAAHEKLHVGLSGGHSWKTEPQN